MRAAQAWTHSHWATVLGKTADQCSASEPLGCHRPAQHFSRVRDGDGWTVGRTGDPYSTSAQGRKEASRAGACRAPDSPGESGGLTGFLLVLIFGLLWVLEASILGAQGYQMQSRGYKPGRLEGSGSPKPGHRLTCASVHTHLFSCDSCSHLTLFPGMTQALPHLVLWGSVLAVTYR